MNAFRRIARVALPLLLGSAFSHACADPGAQPEASAACPGGHGGLSLPPGFCATVFADNLGHTRHMAVTADGTVYVNSWSGRYFRNAPPRPDGGFVLALADRDRDGVADAIERFGPGEANGAHGGSGIALWRDGLFVEEHDTVVRYPLKAGQLRPAGPGVVVLRGLPLSGNHPMHPFAVTADGTLLVNSGSASNTCESPNRQPGARGQDPCIEAETRGGIWAYRADRTGQKFSARDRWAAGIRNTGGIAVDSAGRVFAVQHGRDQLGQNWPKLYTAEQGAELPAEILFSPFKGADFGWPTCYYDGFQDRLVLAPEYGGDGGRTAGRCEGKTPPLVAFPAHWAPNDVAIHSGRSFPAAYAQGAFIAFHGSWNRAPMPQAGYQVVFQPLVDGRPAGRWFRFADGFAGPYREPGRARFRPAGLAVGPDGALFIADDVRGRIWRVTYAGPPDAGLAAAEPAADAPPPAAAVASAPALPPGVTTAMVAAGRAIYQGQAKGGTCAGCHGSDGRGSMAGAPLTGPEFLWSDGSIDGLAGTIARGVEKPKKSGGAMPPKGGAMLDEADVRAVAAYVWTLAHANRAPLR